MIESNCFLSLLVKEEQKTTRKTIFFLLETLGVLLQSIFEDDEYENEKQNERKAKEKTVNITEAT